MPLCVNKHDKSHSGFLFRLVEFYEASASVKFGTSHGQARDVKLKIKHFRASQAGWRAGKPYVTYVSIGRQTKLIGWR